jgi:hypothetical protein
MERRMEIARRVFKNAVNVLVAEIYKITIWGVGLQPYERPALGS